MIYYESGGASILLNIFRYHGSVFKPALSIAIPCAIVSSILQLLFPEGSLRILDGQDGIMLEAQAWGGFSFLVGFLIVFRTSQAYGRFWEGCVASYRMRTEWFDAVSAVMAFTRHSNSSKDEIRRFKELIVRLTSMLHASALAELEAGPRLSPVELWAESYPIIDPAGVDSKSIDTIKRCSMRTELLFTWLQQLIVEQISTGVLNIPAPLLSRVFDEMANGMVAFHDALRISFVPFPFPYTQACDCTLMFHWMLAPLVTSQWVTSPLWAGILTFVQVFILWSLNLIATEIDHPFGRDSNDIDGNLMQDQLNDQLLLLTSEAVDRTPRLSSTWQRSEHGLSLRISNVGASNSTRRKSFTSIVHASSNPKVEEAQSLRLSERPGTLRELFSYDDFSTAGSTSTSQPVLERSLYGSQLDMSAKASTRSLERSVFESQQDMSKKASTRSSCPSTGSRHVYPAVVALSMETESSGSRSPLQVPSTSFPLSSLSQESSEIPSLPAKTSAVEASAPWHESDVALPGGPRTPVSQPKSQRRGPRVKTPRESDFPMPNHEDCAPDLPDTGSFDCPLCGQQCSILRTTAPSKQVCWKCQSNELHGERFVCESCTVEFCWACGNTEKTKASGAFTNGVESRMAKRTSRESTESSGKSRSSSCETGHDTIKLKKGMSRDPSMMNKLGAITEESSKHSAETQLCKAIKTRLP